MEVILETKELCKSFGGEIVNDHINLQLYKGEIMAILGENGSGKTTLINMISGLYYPDKGKIYVKGRPVNLLSPRDADELGIGVVHQHFQLVANMTALENINIALNTKKNKKEIEKQILLISQKYGLKIEPRKKIRDMSVSEKQTVEIVKAIVKGADILILDEPTAVLTPQEKDSLFSILNSMRADGKSIIIITHKLNEVIEISQRVFIMRKGKYIDTCITSETNEYELACKMVGKQINLNIEKTEFANKKCVLEVNELSCNIKHNLQGLKNISFKLYAGEILGVAGISGSGQKELCECLNGIRKVTNGTIIYSIDGNKTDITNKSPEWRNKRKLDLGFVPEDRLGMGLSPSSDLADNMMIKSFKNDSGVFLNRKKYEKLANSIVEEFSIETKNIAEPVRMLSGGNIQKVLLGREIQEDRKVLVVSYPVRGLDINSSYMVYDLLNKEREKGKAVIFVGEDLDVLMAISDRIMVMCDYGISEIVNPDEVSKNYIGSLMMKKEKVV